jgi:hypothetical protein
MDPSIGRIVVYRSRGPVGFIAPAIIAVTQETLAPAGVSLFVETKGARGVPPLSSPDHVHLIVFTAGVTDEPPPDPDFDVPMGGTWREHDVPFFERGSANVGGGSALMPQASHEQPPGTWAWPERR